MPRFEFEWNNASEYDWPKIKLGFVGAYVGAYKHCAIAQLDLDPNIVAAATTRNKDPLTAYFKHAFADEFNKIKQQAGISKYLINYVIARLHDQPVAFASVQFNFKSNRTYVRWNTVFPGYQRLGIGNKMLKQIAHFYGNNSIELYTRAANMQACAFYEKRGFSRTLHFSFAEPNAGEKVSTFVKDWVANPNAKKTVLGPADESVSNTDVYVGYLRLGMAV